MKKPTPKQRQARSMSHRRYKTFQNNARKRLSAMANVSQCPKCKEPKLSHCACPVCGFYKGKSVINKEKEMEKITKVKA